MGPATSQRDSAEEAFRSMGWAMATIQENSDEHGPVRDFAWHCTHRARRGGQLIDIVMLVGWVVVVGWVMLSH